MRFHFWVMIRTEGRAIDEVTFVEPSTGMPHPVSSPMYSGIESVWNHLNYWVSSTKFLYIFFDFYSHAIQNANENWQIN